MSGRPHAPAGIRISFLSVGRYAAMVAGILLALLVLPLVSASASRAFNSQFSNGTTNYICQDASYNVTVTAPGAFGYVLEENLSNGWRFTGRASADAIADCNFDPANPVRMVCQSKAGAGKLLTFTLSNPAGNAIANTISGAIFDSTSPNGALIAGPSQEPVGSNSTCIYDLDGDGYFSMGAIPLNVCGCKSRFVPDCQDTIANIYPGAPEQCGTGIDFNCDGIAPACPSQVQRSLSPFVTKGTTVDVVLYVNWSNMEPAVTFQDNFSAAGYSFVAASGGGVLVGGGTGVRWALADRQNRSVNYTLQANVEGTYNFSGNFQFQGNSSQRIYGPNQSTISQFANVTGVVNDEGGLPVGGAWVSTATYWTGVNVTNSLPDGSYRLDYVPTGTYYMTSYKAGFLPDAHIVTIGPGTNTVNFVLKNGSCNWDCSDSLGRCNAGCDGISFSGGAQCKFYDSTAKQLCDGKLAGTIVTYSVAGNFTALISCCNGAPYTVYRPQATIAGSMRDLIKYTQVVMYESRPAKLVVVVWD